MAGVLCSMVGAGFSVAAVAEILRSKKGISAVGNAQISTAQSKFGGSSALFDGSGDYLDITPTNQFAFGTNNFTIEGWFRFNALPGSGAYFVMFDTRPTSTNGAYATLTLKGSTLVYFANSADRITSSTVSTGVWYHIALSRSDTSTRLFINGTQAGSTYTDSTNYLVNANRIVVGGDSSVGGGLYNGYIDELRVSNTARYTANFTPSTIRFVNDNNTLLLVHMDGTSATNYFEDDNGQTPTATRTAKAITTIGNSQISTTQSKFGGSSAYLDGSGDGIIISNADSSLNLSTVDYTHECWFYPTVVTGSTKIIFNTFGSAGTGNGIFYLEVGYYLRYYSTTYQWAGVNITANSWYHLAISRSSGTTRIFLNGALQATTTTTINLNTPNNVLIGYEGSTPTNFFTGYIDEFRISNSARYLAAFTPSAIPFVNDSSTLVLLHMGGANASTTFTDDVISYRNKITPWVNGNVTISNTQSKFGGTSGYINGSSGTNNALQFGGYLQGETHDRFKWGNFPNYTIESWVYFTAWTSIANATGEDASALCGYAREAGYADWTFGFNRTGKITLTYSTNGGYGNTTLQETGTSGTLNAWHHIAFVRNGNSLKLYVNGVEKAAGTLAGTVTYSIEWFKIGQVGGNNFTAYFDDFRVSNVARYTANFTPATVPFVNDNNTLLLLHADGTTGSKAFIDDNGARSQNGIQAVGNAQVSTAQSQFGGSSALFDGTGDYLTSTDSTAWDLGTMQNWTIDFWFRYISNSTSWRGIIGHQDTSGATSGWGVYLTNNGYIAFLGNTTTSLLTTNISINTWYHIAVVRNGSSLKIFIDGVERASLSNYTDKANASNVLSIGAARDVSSGYQGYLYINGYIDELRISNTTRYTSAFTPSTTPFQNDANTLLLLHMDGTNAATTFVDDNGVYPIIS